MVNHNSKHQLKDVLGASIEKGCYVEHNENILYKNGCQDIHALMHVNGKAQVVSSIRVCLCQGDLCNRNDEDGFAFPQHTSISQDPGNDIAAASSSNPNAGIGSRLKCFSRCWGEDCTDKWTLSYCSSNEYKCLTKVQGKYSYFCLSASARAESNAACYKTCTVLLYM